MDRTELAIASRIAEVIRKLLSHDLSPNCVRARSRREHASPRTTAKRGCAEELKRNEKHADDDSDPCGARERTCARVRTRFPDQRCQEKLCEQERNTCVDHRPDNQPVEIRRMTDRWRGHPPM